MTELRVPEAHRLGRSDFPSKRKAIRQLLRCLYYDTWLQGDRAFRVLRCRPAPREINFLAHSRNNSPCAKGQARQLHRRGGQQLRKWCPPCGRSISDSSLALRRGPSEQKKKPEHSVLLGLMDKNLGYGEPGLLTPAAVLTVLARRTSPHPISSHLKAAAAELQREKRSGTRKGRSSFRANRPRSWGSLICPADDQLVSEPVLVSLRHRLCDSLCQRLLPHRCLEGSLAGGRRRAGAFARTGGARGQFGCSGCAGQRHSTRVRGTALRRIVLSHPKFRADYHE